MARIVQKFGGTSVADTDRIKAVAQRVKLAVDAGDEVAVVVSAMSGTTNQLVEWTRAASPMCDAREYDVVVSAGEQITVGLMAMALQDIGVDALHLANLANIRLSFVSPWPTQFASLNELTILAGDPNCSSPVAVNAVDDFLVY